MTARSFLTRWVVPLIGAGVAIALLFWLYRDLDLGRLLAAVASAKPMWLVVLAGTILLEQWLRGWKWRQILFDLKPISSIRLLGAILAGYGVAILVPLGISPLVRSWLIARLEGLRMASVLTTTAIERFLDGIVFALLAGLVAVGAVTPEVAGPEVAGPEVAGPEVAGPAGNVRTGLVVAGGVSLALFSALLYLLFVGRAPLGRGDTRLSRWIDWLAAKGGPRLDGLRSAIHQGIVWPHERWRQIGAVLASVAMKVVAATHFLWAGLAVGVLLTAFDYLFLMVFAGFAMVLARFVRVPAGFVIGSGFALELLGVPEEQALAMILLNYVLTIVLMVGPGLVFLWRGGADIRRARFAEMKGDARP